MRSIKDIQDAMKRKFGEFAPDATFTPKAIVLKDRKVNREARMVSGIITTVSPDNQGEVVVTSGIDSTYLEKFKTVYLGHDYDKPIGSMRRLKRVPNDKHPTGLWASAYISETALGEDVLTMIGEEVINGTSIGFASMDFGPPTDDEAEEFGECGGLHRRSKLFEYSMTPMPCNADAVISEVTMKDLDRLLCQNKILRSTAVACGLPTTPIRKYHRAMPIMFPDGTVGTAIRGRS